MSDLTSLGYPQGYHLGFSVILWNGNLLPREEGGNYRRNSPNMKISTTLLLTAPEDMYIPKQLTEAINRRRDSKELGLGRL